MVIVFENDGSARTLYTEEINLSALGKLQHTRASHVEPTQTGQWQADLSPVGGPILGPFALRSLALEAERNWLEMYLQQ